MADDRKRVLTMVAKGKITVDEGERLLDALAGSAEPPDPAASSESTPRKKLKYLRVQIADAAKGDHVNVRIPLALIRAGIKLKGLLPERARQALADKGIDLSGKGQKPIEELVEALGEVAVEVEEGGEAGSKVRVFCE